MVVEAAAGHGGLLASIALCIGVAAAFAFAAARLKQPALLAYLAAGVLIGPEIGLGWVSDPHAVEIISEVGLILLLFMIGLEIDLKKLVASGRPVIVTGLLQFPICFFLGLPFFKALGFGLGDADAVGGPFGAGYLALAAGLSSTMIVVKLLYDKSELGTLPGRISLGVLVFQDLWIVVALAFQPNLDNPRLAPLLLSLLKGGLLVAACFALSRYVLPRLFHSIAKLPELMLTASLAWVFLVCAAASAAGLSPEMGALIAGVAMSTFPYSLDVTAKVTSIRDFFVTLYFVGLGMKIPLPTPGILAVAGASSLFLIATRFLTIFPILYGLKLGHRASLVPSINLTQMCDFTLVFASLGLAAGHIDQGVVSVLVLVYAITSISSTYMINFSDRLWKVLGRAASRLGLRDIGEGAEEPDGEEKGKPVVFLGFYRHASSILHEFELNAADGKKHPLLEDLLVIDFNPEVHAELQRRGIACRYGDIAHADTLHHAGLHAAELAICTVSDAILKGTSNARLLQQVRAINPHARVILSASGSKQALELYDLGADDVYVPRLDSAADMARLIEESRRAPSEEAFRARRDERIARLRRRAEVLA